MNHAYRRQLPLLLLPAAADAARHSPLGTLVLISTCINTLFLAQSCSHSTGGYHHGRHLERHEERRRQRQGT